jgi:riboflavin kinase/FMN adenylyltransferase
MQSIKGIENNLSSGSDSRGTVLTFGVFDGVHMGHQMVIRRVVNRAAALNLEAIVISFDPHPALPISGEAPLNLTTTAKKIELLKSMGIDRVVVKGSNENFYQLLPDEFVREILIQRFNVREVVVGYDCTFGKDKAGDKWLLRDLGKKYGFAVDIVEPYRLFGDVVSSTRIRKAILQGYLEIAKELLGRPYSLLGPVVSGKGIGHKIGYATANLEIENQVLPPSGVYAVKVLVEGQHFDGVLNMGVQPTFHGSDFRVEVHLLDFEGTLYEKMMEVLFIRKIRDEIVFSSPQELAAQIGIDANTARKILKDV